MRQACPINFEKYDNTLSRIVSVYMMAGLGIYIGVGSVWILLFLFVDLLLRTHFEARYSFIYQIASVTKERLGFKSVMKDGAAKKLASHFGLLFLIVSIPAHFYADSIVVYSVVGIYFFCLFLDAFFDFCLGCKIYHFFKLFNVSLA